MNRVKGHAVHLNMTRKPTNMEAARAGRAKKKAERDKAKQEE